MAFPVAILMKPEGPSGLSPFLYRIRLLEADDEREPQRRGVDLPEDTGNPHAASTRRSQEIDGPGELPLSLGLGNRNGGSGDGLLKINCVPSIALPPCWSVLELPTMAPAE
jgi:hypothetical protein